MQKAKNESERKQQNLLLKEQHYSENMKRKIQKNIQEQAQNKRLVSSEKLLVDPQDPIQIETFQRDSSSLWWTKVNLATMQPTPVVPSSFQSSRIKFEPDNRRSVKPVFYGRGHITPKQLSPIKGYVYEPLPHLDQVVPPKKQKILSIPFSFHQDKRNREEERAKIQECIKRILVKKKERH